MPVTWKIENIETTDGSNIVNVSWRVNGDTVGTGMNARTPTAYGQVSIEGVS